MFTVQEDCFVFTKEEFNAYLMKAMQDGYNKAMKEIDDNKHEIIKQAEEVIKKLMIEKKESFNEGYRKGLMEKQHAPIHPIDEAFNKRLKEFIGNADYNETMKNWLENIKK